MPPRSPLRGFSFGKKGISLLEWRIDKMYALIAFLVLEVFV